MRLPYSFTFCTHRFISRNTRVLRRQVSIYFVDVALWFSYEVDSVFSASFGFEDGFVGLLEEVFYCLAVAGEACQAAVSNSATLIPTL